MHKQPGWLQAWEYCQAKLIQTLGRGLQGVDWSWSQCIKSHHAQTSSGKGLPSHFWTRDNVRSILPGLWRKITQRSQSLEEEWRGTESMLLEVQCEVSTVSDDLGCHVICWCWSTCVFQLHASFCWQALWRCWFHFPAGLGTCPHCQRYQKLVQWPWCYCAWLASKLAWPEPHRESMGYCQEEDERHQTQQCRWAEGHCQRNLGFHTTSAVPQTDHLHATPNWGSN